MNFVQATASYEHWISKQMRVLSADIRLKHERMRSGLFPFLRATYYRWAQRFPQVCPDLGNAPKVLSVGDLHIENFGTWRDIDGRLVWGINDFDEVWPLPYTNDLVRVAASARIAIETAGLSLRPVEAYASIIDGYKAGLDTGGRPYVLAEKSGWLRDLAVERLRDPVAFWEGMTTLPRASGRITEPAATLLKNSFPETVDRYTLSRRVAGLGSLGHPRFVAVANWRGGLIAREAKQVSSSASAWAESRKPAPIQYNTILSRAVRCPDPSIFFKEPWLVRRLAPDCTKLDISSIPKQENELRYFRAIGRETANIHLGTPRATKLVQKHLSRLELRNPKWLRSAVNAMVHDLLNDWKEWKKGKQ